MRLTRVRMTTRRLFDALPLARHDAVSGAPRATWHSFTERGPVAAALRSEFLQRFFASVLRAAMRLPT